MPSIKDDGFSPEVCEHIANVLAGAFADLKHQHEMLEHTTGEVNDAYRRVLLDKAHKLSQLVGTMWNETLTWVSEFELKIRNQPTSSAVENSTS